MAYEGYQGYGGASDPQSIANRLAQAQLLAGMSTAPIRSKTQGYAQLAQALMGGLALRQRQNAVDQAQSDIAGPLGNLLGGGGGMSNLTPYAPGASSAIVPGASGGFAPPPVNAGSGPMAPNNSAGGGAVVASNDPRFMPGFTEPSSDSASGGGASAGAPMPLMGSLTAMGYSPNAAAGILGNFKQESGLNPSNSSGDSGTSIGMGQWHNERAAALQQFAAAQGQDWRNPAVQFAFTDKEISQTPGLKEAMNNAGSPQEAAAIFMNKFERPAAATANLAGRENYAAQFAGGGGTGAQLVAMQQARENGLQDAGGQDPSMMVAGPGARSGNEATSPAPPNMDWSGIVRAAMMPDAPPELRQLAGTLIQNRLNMVAPHPYQYQAIPGTNNERQLDWLGNPTGKVLTGGPKTEKLAPGEQIFQGTSGGVFEGGQPGTAGGQATGQGGGAVAGNSGTDFYRQKAAAEATGQAQGKLGNPSAEDAARLFEVRKDPQFAETENATNVYNSMINEAKVDSHVADKALIDAYAKINNPGRAIGVGQYNINADIQSLPQTIQGEVMKAYEGGGVLSTQTRAAMLSLARQRIDQYQSAWQKARAPAISQAQRMGLDPNRFVPDVPKPNEPQMGEISQYQFDTGTTTLRDKRSGAVLDPNTFQPLPNQPAPVPSATAPAQGTAGGRIQDRTQAAPEVTEQQYNQLPSGSLYRVPGSPKVMRKP